MLDPVDLREHLLHRQGNEVFDLARRYDNCKYAEQHRRKREQRRQRIVLEAGGKPARDSELILHRSPPPAI